jgi:hypothetical protein
VAIPLLGPARRLASRLAKGLSGGHRPFETLSSQHDVTYVSRLGPERDRSLTSFASLDLPLARSRRRRRAWVGGRIEPVVARMSEVVGTTSEPRRDEEGGAAAIHGSIRDAIRDDPIASWTN